MPQRHFQQAEEKIMKTLGYYNGKISPLQELMIPANDRCVYYGDGVYDAAYGRCGNIFAADEHIERFMNSCRMLSITPGFSNSELKAVLYRLVDEAEADDFCLYWQMSRATAMRKHSFPDESKPNLLITIRPHEMLDVSKKRLSLHSVEDNRYFYCNIKTINLIPNVFAAEAAKRAGCDEAVFVRNGYVTEGSHSNIAIIKDGKFITAPLTNLILPGTTRAHYIAICNSFGIPVLEKAFTLSELEQADEVMVMASSIHGAACSSVNGKPIGGKAPDIYKAISSEYRKKFISETERRM